MINKMQAIKLFEENACLVGDRDVIPSKNAMKIVDQNAINFAGRMKRGCSSLYGIGDYNIEYLTREGFFLAVTYMNVAEDREMNSTRIDVRKC